MDRLKTYKHEVPMKDVTRLALLEQSIMHINDTLLRIEKRFDTIDFRFDKQELQVGAVSTEVKRIFRDINQRLWTNFIWMIAGFASVLGVIAHAVHWF